MSVEDSPRHSLFERLLAYASLTIIAAAVIAYLTTLIVGLVDRTVLEGGMWPIIVTISYVGLPIGFVLLLVLLGVNYSRRGSNRRGRA